MRRHNTRPLQDVFKIPFGRAVLLALRRSLGHKLDGVHLRPPYIDAVEGRVHSLNADRLLDDIQLRAGIHQPLHEAEVVARYIFEGIATRTTSLLSSLPWLRRTP